eukprot:4478650-Pleurochrysis_carterae.AAC.4
MHQVVVLFQHGHRRLGIAHVCDLEHVHVLHGARARRCRTQLSVLRTREEWSRAHVWHVDTEQRMQADRRASNVPTVASRIDACLRSCNYVRALGLVLYAVSTGVNDRERAPSTFDKNNNEEQQKRRVDCDDPRLMEAQTPSTLHNTELWPFEQLLAFSGLQLKRNRQADQPLRKTIPLTCSPVSQDWEDVASHIPAERSLLCRCT